MSYDWEKIFKGKTNKELYQIYLGNTHLPIQTSHYAKKELENRNFDFHDMQTNKKVWKLKSLIEEETHDSLWQRTRFFIPYIYIIVALIISTLIFLYIYEGYEDFFGLGFWFLFLIGATVGNNSLYKKQQKTRKQINDLENDLKAMNHLKDEGIEMNEIIISTKNIKKNHKIIMIISFSLFLLFWLLKIFKIIE